MLAAQDFRAELGEEDATALEELVRVFFPQMPLRWGKALEAESPPGQWQVVQVSSFATGDHGREIIVFGAVSLKSDREQAIKRVEQFEAVPAGTVPLRFAVLFTNASGQIVEQRSGFVDLEPSVAETDRLGVVEWEGRWPTFEVKYTGFYSRPTWMGGVEWNAKVDSDTMKLVERLPARSWKQPKGGQPVFETYESERVGDKVEMKAQRSGRTFQYACAPDCVVPLQLILGQP